MLHSDPVGDGVVLIKTTIVHPGSDTGSGIVIVADVLDHLQLRFLYHHFGGVGGILMCCTVFGPTDAHAVVEAHSLLVTAGVEHHGGVGDGDGFGLIVVDIRVGECAEIK